MQRQVGYRGIAEAGAASARQIYGFMDWMYRPPPAPRLLDGYWERNLQLWKIASGQIMVREAGGTISGIEGSDDPPKTGHMVCGNEYGARGVGEDTGAAGEVSALLAHHPNRHHPRRRMIQYAAASRFSISSVSAPLEYWVTRLRG
jgi:Inositol monophosphatase family